jgi:hypothetical protein
MKNNQPTWLQKGIILSITAGIIGTTLTFLFAFIVYGLPLLGGFPIYVGKEILLGASYIFTILTLIIWMVAIGGRDIGKLIEHLSNQSNPDFYMNGGGIQGLVAGVIAHIMVYTINTHTGIWDPTLLHSNQAIFFSIALGIGIGIIHELFDYNGWYDWLIEKSPIITPLTGKPKTNK